MIAGGMAADLNSTGPLNGNNTQQLGSTVRSDNVMDAANQIEQGKNQLKQIINILEEDRLQIATDQNEQLKVQIPETEEEIMQFLQQA